MQNFQFYSPTEFVFGRDTEDRAGELVKKHGGSKVLIHYGGGSAERSGLLGRVRASLDKAGVSYVELGGVKRSAAARPLIPQRLLLAECRTAAISGTSTAERLVPRRRSPSALC